MDEKPVAIVTAASRGIGKACAKRFSDENYNLVVFSRSEDISTVASELNAKAVQGDLNNVDDIQDLVKYTIGEFGRVDAVINNTGHSAKGELLDISDESWTNGFELLFLSISRMAKLLIPEMLKIGGGSFVNISSFAANEPSLDFPVSSVVRSSVSSYAKLIAKRFGGEGIRMNNVLPGFVDSYEVTQTWLDKIPMKRPATTQEVADLVYFLSGDQSNYINGQSLTIDGGLSNSY